MAINNEQPILTMYKITDITPFLFLPIAFANVASLP